MKKNILFSLLLLGFYSSFAQNIVVSKVLNWQKTTLRPITEGKSTLETYTFDGANFSPKAKGLPAFTMTLPVSSNGKLLVDISNVVYEPISLSTDINTESLSVTPKVETEVNMQRNDFIGVLRFVPIIKSASGFQRLTSFDLNIRLQPQPLPIALRTDPTFTSVLSSGNIYKIAIENTGLQRIDAKLLKDLGIDINNLNPKKIKIYGNASGMLPEAISTFRYDDLEENAIYVSGEDDGKFNDNDYILFYGVGADRWDYNSAKKRFDYVKNVYATTSYYFIKIDGDEGKRITTKPSLANTAFTVTSFDEYAHYEKETFNLLGSFNYTTGSGRDWYGDKFTPTKPSTTISDIKIPNLEIGAPINITSAMAIRSSRGGTYNMSVGGNVFSGNASGVSLSDSEGTYADIASIDSKTTLKNTDLTVDIDVSSANGDFEAWLDYITVNTRRQMIMSGSQMGFRAINTLDYPTATFELKNANNIEVWNITNPTNPIRQEGSNNNGVFSFGTETKSLAQFVAFNTSATDFNKPKAVGKIANQNIHAITKTDMIIVYPKEFEDQATRLANHRMQQNKLKVNLVQIDQIYNEFSSGAQDVTAIRDFVKMVHDRDQNFRYLLLMGDGSFNHRSIGVDASKNLNRIPVYETKESLDPISAFPSDDYFGLLSPNEGEDLRGALDISVGRITAQDDDQLKAIIDKIILYDSNPIAMKDFRNRVVMVTDDAEESWEKGFLDHSESVLWKERTTKYPIFNTEKIYLDAYPQVTTPGGQRSPDCQEAINNNMFKGCLVMNYVGHGGPRGWAQERILNANEDVPTWTNFERLPLFITATCSFAGYDNPNNFTAGEQVLASDKGGAVGLFATVRSVYATANDALTRSVFGEIYKKIGYNGRAMGDILRAAKNGSGTDTENNRKFAMLGDPSQRLMIPQYNVSTISINGKNIQSRIDTAGALSKVEIEGAVTDSTNNTLDWFNGKVYVTLFDKAITLKTIPNSLGQQSFESQNRVLFKGAATVRNGRFKITCIVPKDIDYSLGFAKISYYATNDTYDAAGFDNTHLVVGGASKNPIKDNTPPMVEVFMDNEQFVKGGLTSKNPVLLVRLTDDVGFNVSGTSVGHDMKAILDENTQNSFVLNDFYEAAQDDHTKGKVKYQLSKLSEGTHKISVKAWDVANNPGEGFTEFVVATTSKNALEHVLNYPNPFTTNTSFQFRHHLPELNIKVQIRIFTVSGKLVKTIMADAATQDGRVNDIAWDGKDDYGDDLARGVYIYKVNIQSPNNSSLTQESEFEKLVILK